MWSVNAPDGHACPRSVGHRCAAIREGSALSLRQVTGNADGLVVPLPLHLIKPLTYLFNGATGQYQACQHDKNPFFHNSP